MSTLSIKPSSRLPNIGLNLTVSLPATPVLTTAEAKTYARIDFSEDDTLIDALIESATLWVQKILNRALINQTVIAEWDSVGYEVRLPYGEVSAISSIVTVDDEGTETALTLNSGYFLRNNIIKVSTPLGLKVTYTAGYGAASSDVPRPIRTAIERIVLGLYDRRDDEIIENNVDQLEFNAMSLLRPYINHNAG